MEDGARNMEDPAQNRSVRATKHMNNQGESTDVTCGPEEGGAQAKEDAGAGTGLVSDPERRRS